MPAEPCVSKPGHPSPYPRLCRKEIDDKYHFSCQFTADLMVRPGQPCPLLSLPLDLPLQGLAGLLCLEGCVSSLVLWLSANMGLTNKSQHVLAACRP